MSRIRNILGLLFVALVSLGLSAAPALAAPELGVTVERDEGAFPAVYHSDERVDLTARVANTAPQALNPGDLLTCDPREWSGEPSFAYKWIAGGAEVGTGETYEVQASDEGEAIQCLVTGENAGGASVSFSVPLFAAPLPSPEAPTYTDAERPEPTVTGTAAAGNEITCERRPNAWSGSLSWSFEWLLDGGAPNGVVTGTTATTSTYEVAAGDVPGNLQCVAIATTGSGEPPSGGTVVSISRSAFTSPAPSPLPPRNSNASKATKLPLITTPSRTSGPVTLELELPGGTEVFAFAESSGWGCTTYPAAEADHARVVCGREDPIDPGGEFPPLTVIAALGADAPDLASAKATVIGGGMAAPASGELSFPIEPALPFGLSKFTAALLDEAGEVHVQAGGHPHAGVSEVDLNHRRGLYFPVLPVAQTKQVIADLPPGVVGNQLALPELCPDLEGVCPPGSVVGAIELGLPESSSATEIYAVEPEFGLPAQFVFSDPFTNIYTFSPRLRPEDGYAVSLELAPAVEVNVLGAVVTFCDYGVKETSPAVVCKEAGEPGANPRPLFTQPTRCGALTTRLRANSWEDDTFLHYAYPNEPITGCDKVPFEPQADLQPTSSSADSPTGLDVELSMPTEGLEKGSECHEVQGDETSPLAEECISQSALRKAEITFPEGMAVNPSAGAGLGACSAEQVKLGTNDPISCPQSSKVGSVEIETPILENPLEGALYVAKQGEVEGSLLGLYMVFDSPKDGILVKQASAIRPDPVTGQLTATVKEIPQAPISKATIHLPGWARSTLLTPPKCGSHEIASKLTPWSGGVPVTIESPFEIDSGPGGGPCPDGDLQASFAAGSANPLAGQTTPFNVHLTRPDGSDRFKALGLKMPAGLTAYLRGLPYCPVSTLAAISRAAGTGQEEIDRPSCPAASQIGRVIVGAGAGESPFYVDTGKAYLAPPTRAPRFRSP